MKVYLMKDKLWIRQMFSTLEENMYISILIIRPKVLPLNNSESKLVRNVINIIGIKNFNDSKSE